MILQPAALALQLIALLVSAMGLYAGYYGIRILGRWDPASGSEGQLELERRTYLVSTIMSYILSFELMSLFLFIYTADDLHSLFTGAMCAAGTLAVNSFGYPALLFKIVNFLLAGVWLIVNHADNRGYDYPLIRVKYRLLSLIVPLLLLESGLLFAYFDGLKPDIITSCCGSLFSHESRSISGDLASLPHLPMQIIFFSGMAITLASGLYFYSRGRLAYLFSAAATITFLIAVAAILSFISLYFYELPTHHCPFCLLQKEYGYIGYLLYATLFGGAVAGIGVGALMPFGKVGSLARIIPVIQRRLTIIALVNYLLFTLIVVWTMVFSALKLS
ncbi:MAG: hypothetical protein HGB32_02715 [Geobacteraceae bacterium]|nr:hypothetical protein [Geobacteraceae bacterium]NTW79046.1 hypothetical protein [Geobacteraceae bacterium]